MPPPKNLQVLPKNLSGEQVRAIMHKFAGDLGVECSYCHYRDPETHRMDFASDANPKKNRARVMIRMTHAIDTEYLTQLTDPKPEHDVTCGTCHRGMAKPAVFIPPPEKQEHREGPPPGTPSTPPSH